MLITEKKLRKIIREIIKESNRLPMTFEPDQPGYYTVYEMNPDGTRTEIGVYPEHMLVFKDGKLVGVSATQSKQYSDKDLPPELRSTNR